MMEARRELEGWAKSAVDLGPVVVFFAAYQLARRQPGITDVDATIQATAVFIAAALAAMAFALWRIRRVPGMLLFTTALVCVFGGLTIWLRDETFIKMKPTIVYAGFAAVLWGGLLAGRNYLRLVLTKAIPGLSDDGWNGLARRWALFFAAMAALNELVWRVFPTDVWFHFKTWGDLLLTFAFMFALAPFLKRHGARFE